MVGPCLTRASLVADALCEAVRAARMAARSSTTIAYEPPCREEAGGAETEILAKLQEKVGGPKRQIKARGRRSDQKR